MDTVATGTLNARELAHRIDDKPQKSGKEWRVNCLTHPGKCLDISDGDRGGIRLHCKQGCNSNGIIDELVKTGIIQSKSELFYGPSLQRKTVVQPTTKPDDDAVKRGIAKRLAASATPATNHPYSDLKQFNNGPLLQISNSEVMKLCTFKDSEGKTKNLAYGLKGGCLVVPLKNASGSIQAVELIDIEGSKRAIGSKGGAWFQTSQIPHDTTNIITLEEGAADALTASMAGFYGVASMGIENLEIVAQYFKKKYPRAKLVVVVDMLKDDNKTPDPKAVEIANSLNLPIAIPSVNEPQHKDINDQLIESGLDSVRNTINRAIQGSRPKGFGFVRLDEIEIKPVDWLVKKHFERDAIALIYGPPGSFKSFVAIDLACCVATGKPWHGNEVKQGAVFYIAGEGHNGLARRFKAWEKVHNQTLTGFDIYPSRSSTNLVDDDEAQKAMQAIESVGVTPQLIVIDTLARNYIGDENSAECMGRFIRNLDRMREAWPGCTILLVHHSGKDLSMGSRGSSALKGALDTEYSVFKANERECILECRKMKEAEEAATSAFRITSVELGGFDEDGNPIGGAALVKTTFKPPARKLGTNQQILIDTLEKLTNQQRETLKDSGREPDEIHVSIEDVKKESGLTSHQWKDSRNALEKSGQITIKAPHIYSN